MYSIKPEITKQFILDNVSQEDVFRYYGVPITYNRSFRSPFRKDRYPTCTLKWLGDSLFFRDWSEYKPKDCFQLVVEQEGITFPQALQFIYHQITGEQNARNLILNTRSTVYDSSSMDISSSGVRNSLSSDRKRSHFIERKKVINVKVPNRWQPGVVNYFRQYHLNGELLKQFNIYPVDKLWIDQQLKWRYNPNDPAVGYYFGNDEAGNQKWKIYFINRTIFRFICNTNRINGWIQLPDKDDLLIITKSMKDVVCMKKFGVTAIAMQNETTTPYGYIMDELKNRFNKIVSFYDFDRTGVTNANILRKLYDVPAFFLTNGRFSTTDYQAKDFSDLLKLKGATYAKKVVEQIKTAFL